jgi:hypothetical protein
MRCGAIIRRLGISSYSASLSGPDLGAAYSIGSEDRCRAPRHFYLLEERASELLNPYSTINLFFSFWWQRPSIATKQSQVSCAALESQCLNFLFFRETIQVDDPLL